MFEHYYKERKSCSGKQEAHNKVLNSDLGFSVRKRYSIDTAFRSGPKLSSPINDL